ncbi:MAG: adenosine deaminase [Acidimicrobiia bacterium]|jgi:adenosine deaminase|nr:adenosine deaminase [Acidimicrobiia bacterium]
MDDLITRLPKAELHVHIEGTLEPDMMFRLATRNGLSLPFEDIDQVHAAYRFSDLQSFLDIYYQGGEVLRTPDDFYDLMTAYLDRAADDGVRHAEIFFDPQSHTGRGIGFEVFMRGFRDAISDGRRRRGISADLIMCFLRHLSGEEAVSTIEEAEPFLDGVIGVGIDSSERGRPPHLFERAFARARQLGLRSVAHAGEEGPPEYVRAALDVLGAERIDHGVRSLEDPELVARLSRDKVPLTVCPLSNVALKVVEDLARHPLPAMIEAGLVVSVNSDDPAYFGGYIGDNYRGVRDDLGLDDATITVIARNSINSSFLDDRRKTALLLDLESFSAGDEG